MANAEPMEVGSSDEVMVMVIGGKARHLSMIRARLFRFFFLGSCSVCVCFSWSSFGSRPDVFLVRPLGLVLLAFLILPVVRVLLAFLFLLAFRPPPSVPSCFAFSINLLCSPRG